MFELRKDPLLGRWTITAKDDTKKLSDYDLDPFIPKDKSCTFCPGAENKTTKEIMTVKDKETGKWLTRVIPNRIPILRIEGNINRQGVGMYDKMNGIGANEIIIESPEHTRWPEDIGASQMEKVLTTYGERIIDLEKDSRLRYVLIFKSYGEASGATMEHPHSQLIATPVTPKRIKEELDGAKNYFSIKERCIFCDIIKEEQKTGLRVVVENKDFIAFCPFAQIFPFETWLLPKRHNCAFQDVDDSEIASLASILTDILNRIKSVLNNPSYNYSLHTAPNRMPRKGHWFTLMDDFHWHIEIIPKLKMVTGFELSSGFFVIYTPPEESAEYLRGEY
ncbi:MAG: galactose-1-phosphate uridylyltransferase [Nitrospirota bacterium]